MIDYDGKITLAASENSSNTDHSSSIPAQDFQVRKLEYRISSPLVLSCPLPDNNSLISMKFHYHVGNFCMPFHHSTQDAELLRVLLLHCQKLNVAKTPFFYSKFPSTGLSRFMRASVLHSLSMMMLVCSENQTHYQAL
jgi:hypothetical protein